MKAERILVFSPHPDDAVIGCGGTLALAQADGARVKVAVITDGEKGLQHNQQPELQREECIGALKILGIEDVIFWGFPGRAAPLSDSIIENYRNVVSAFSPHCIVLPSPADSNADHRRVARGVIKSLEGRWNGRLLFYETSQPLLINIAKDVTPVIKLKRSALLAYASQMEEINLEELCMLLARLRGFQAGVEFAEAFLAYDWDGSKQNFFETRPLISVIVRADNLLHLRNALESLVAQQYDQLEVVLVWHGAEKIDLAEFGYLDIQIVEGAVHRGQNLNLGLSHAKGEYIAFLNQDDILYPRHLELLLSQLHGNAGCDIVYSGCKTIHCDISDGTVSMLHEEASFNYPYQPGRLLCGNYIPIHSLLFRSDIFSRHRFDESLSSYEDWEILARLEMSGYRFYHVDDITCEYRLFGRNGSTIEEVHASKGYLSQNEAVFSRIIKKMSAQNLDQLSKLVGAQDGKIRELEELAAKQKKLLEDNREKLNEYQSGEALLEKGMAAAGIDRHGSSAIAATVGSLLSGEALFSIILPVFNVSAAILEETLLSIRKQVFKGWELCVVDDASDREDTMELLSSLRTDEFYRGRLHFLRLTTRGGIVNALNKAADNARLPYLVFVDHDDLLHEEALLTLALAIINEKKYTLLYTDSRTVDLAGNPLHIYHKPDWAPDNLLCGNYINHLTAVRRDIFDSTGRFREGYEGSQDLDLLLRLSSTLTDADVRHIETPLYDWRAVSDSVAYSGSAKPYAFESARRAITDHLKEKGLTGVSIINSPKGMGFSCGWQTGEKDIEAIIPTKNNASGLKKCIEGLLHDTDFPGLFITIVSNNSSSPAMAAYLDAIRTHERVRIITDNRPFNWSALNNRAVAESSSALLLFMNDDVEVMEKTWLINMSKYLMLDGVGIVGATLFYPNGSLQHNGIRTDEKYIAANITTWGRKSQFTTSRNVSAVTGACLLTSRKTLDSVGGFNEEFPRSYNDVDLCLNIRSKGLRIVQSADAQLVHHESKTCGEVDNPLKKEEWVRSSDLMRNKWGKQLKEKYSATYDIFAQSTRILRVR